MVFRCHPFLLLSGRGKLKCFYLIYDRYNSFIALIHIFNNFVISFNKNNYILRYMNINSQHISLLFLIVHYCTRACVRNYRSPSHTLLNKLDKYKKKVFKAMARKRYWIDGQMKRLLQCVANLCLKNTLPRV